MSKERNVMIAALTSNRKLLAWMPALLILAACAFVAAGINIVKPAHAATDSVTVNGTVSGTLAVSNGCTGSLTFGTNFASGGGGQVSPTCSIDYKGNAPNGANLVVNDTTAGDAFFGLTSCHPTCAGGNTFTDAPGPYPENTMATGEFGINLDSVSGTNNTGTMTASAVPTTAAGKWYNVPSGGRQVCNLSAASATNVSCVVRFGGIPKALQNAGAYTGIAQFTATDNP